MYVYRVHRVGKDVVVAIADRELIGKKWKYKDIEIRVEKKFYGNEEVDDAAAIKLIRNATIVNAIGNNIVNLLVHENIVPENCVLDLNGVKHVQIIKVFE